MICAKSFECVVDTKKPITNVPQWFIGANMNYAENILRYDDDQFALFGAG